MARCNSCTKMQNKADKLAQVVDKLVKQVGTLERNLKIEEERAEHYRDMWQKLVNSY